MCGDPYVISFAVAIICSSQGNHSPHLVLFLPSRSFKKILRVVRHHEDCACVGDALMIASRSVFGCFFLVDDVSIVDDGLKLSATPVKRHVLLFLCCCSSSLSPPPPPPQCGAADAEIKVPSGENTELKRSPFKA